MPAGSTTNYLPAVVALMSFLGTLAATFVGGYFTRRNEHEKWLRQERLQAYSGFVGKLSLLYDLRREVNRMYDRDELLEGSGRVEETRKEVSARRRELVNAQSLVVILGTQHVVDLSRELVTHTARGLPWAAVSRDEFIAYRDKFFLKRREFVEVAREEFILASDRSAGFPIDEPFDSEKPEGAPNI